MWTRIFVHFLACTCTTKDASASVLLVQRIEERAMSVIEVKVPDIGDFDAVEVIEVLVKPGDEVEVDQSLIVLESDKATMDVP